MKYLWIFWCIATSVLSWNEISELYAAHSVIEKKLPEASGVEALKSFKIRIRKLSNINLWEIQIKCCDLNKIIFFKEKKFNYLGYLNLCSVKS